MTMLSIFCAKYFPNYDYFQHPNKIILFKIAMALGEVKL